MLSFFKRNALGVLLFGGLVIALCGSQTADANDRNSQYWTNQWSWYDGTYRPYYRQQSRQTFNYGYNYGQYNGSRGYNYNGYNGGNWGGNQGQFGNPYQNQYQFQHPNQGHWDVYQVGPTRFGVWH